MLKSLTHDGLVHQWYAGGSVSNSEPNERYKGPWSLTLEAASLPDLGNKQPEGKYKGHSILTMTRVWR